MNQRDRCFCSRHSFQPASFCPFFWGVEVGAGRGGEKTEWVGNGGQFPSEVPGQV